MDCLAFILCKDFFHQRVNLPVQYVTPRLFLDGNSISKTESEAVSSYDFYDINETIRHSLMFTFSYRFMEERASGSTTVACKKRNKRA